MPYINCNNVTIHYDEIGEGYPFFFLHGLGNDNKQTREMYAPVEGVRCIIPDQRAHGLSSWDGNISFELMCADVLALADHLGIERIGNQQPDGYDASSPRSPTEPHFIDGAIVEGEL